MWCMDDDGQEEDDIFYVMMMMGDDMNTFKYISDDDDFQITSVVQLQSD